MYLTLISPRLAFQKGDFLGSGVPYWPLELAVTAKFLMDKGHNISVLDLFGESPKTLEEKSDHFLQGTSIADHRRDPALTNAEFFIIFGISYMSHNEILEIVKFLKLNFPNTPASILENSQAVTAYSLSHMSGDFFEAGADFLLCGEIYWNWDKIEEYFTSNSEQPENVLSKTQPERSVKRRYNKYPSYPTPAWELFNLEGYWSLPYSHGPKKSKKFLPIFTSRGCPYPCDFCVVPETNTRMWRARAAEEVVNEMLELRDKFNVSYFQIEDLNPTVKGQRWVDISNLLVKKNANVHFSFVSGTKAETLKPENVQLLAKAGCHYISISPESGSSDVLKVIGKPFNHEHALKLIKACHENGIYTQACILVGHPAEKASDHELSKQYIKQMIQVGLDEVAVFVVASLAGSKIYTSQSIDINTKDALPSFSPKGRTGWETLEKRRKELIRTFFLEKFKRGLSLWLQGVRALLGSPRTKMENLPRRVIYIYWLMLKHRFSNKKITQ